MQSYRNNPEGEENMAATKQDERERFALKMMAKEQAETVKEPIHIISLGAGVQSSCMSLMAARGEITPMPVAAIFADTQDEPDSVYKWLDWLENQLPFPVHRVTKGKLSSVVVKQHTTKDGRITTRSGIPFYTLQPNGERGISIRNCTYDFKIAPLVREAKKLIKTFQSDSCVMWIGISLDEVQRMKESRERKIEHLWPLIDLGMKRHDCLNWMVKNGYPKPPRSACIFCPYHSNTEWRNLTNQEFTKAVDFEKEIQKSKLATPLRGTPFLHKSCKPLDTVDFSTEEERGQINMFNNECEGMCGV